MTIEKFIVNSQDEINEKYFYTNKGGSPKVSIFPCVLVQSYCKNRRVGYDYQYTVEHIPDNLSQSKYSPPNNMSDEYNNGWNDAVLKFCS